MPGWWIVPCGPGNTRPPTLPWNLGLGAMGGLACGLSLAFFVAFIDDRVKSAYHIESLVGLSLIGVIPRMRASGQGEKNAIVQANADPLRL